MIEIKLEKRYPLSRVEDITDAFMRGYEEGRKAESIWREKVEAAFADRKTENSSEKPNNCEHITKDGVTCAKYPACDDCLDNPLNKVKGSERLLKGKDGPQKHCHRSNDVVCHPEQGDMWCKGCDYWYANEPQTERGSE